MPGLDWNDTNIMINPAGGTGASGNTGILGKIISGLGTFGEKVSDPNINKQIALLGAGLSKPGSAGERVGTLTAQYDTARAYRTAMYKALAGESFDNIPEAAALDPNQVKTIMELKQTDQAMRYKALDDALKRLQDAEEHNLNTERFVTDVQLQIAKLINESRGLDIDADRAGSYSTIAEAEKTRAEAYKKGTRSYEEELALEKLKLSSIAADRIAAGKSARIDDMRGALTEARLQAADKTENQYGNSEFTADESGRITISALDPNRGDEINAFYMREFEKALRSMEAADMLDKGFTDAWLSKDYKYNFKLTRDPSGNIIFEKTGE